MKCHYCGSEYDPMPVYTRPRSRRIHVCHYRALTPDAAAALGEDEIICRAVQLTFGGNDVVSFAIARSPCPERARAEGYAYRAGLTGGEAGLGSVRAV